MLSIFPVFEAPWYKEKPLWPWPIASVDAFSYVPITSESDDATIGSFFAGFSVETNPPDVRSAAAQLEDIIEEGALVRNGGMSFEDDGVTIHPGCCGDLRAAIEWMNFLSAEKKPWAGHDPAPWATFDGDDIVIWSDGGLDDRSIEPCIRTTRAEFEVCLASACRELSEFGKLCGTWLADHDIPKADEIHARITNDFDLLVQSIKETEQDASNGG